MEERGRVVRTLHYGNNRGKMLLLWFRVSPTLRRVPGCRSPVLVPSLGTEIRPVAKVPTGEVSAVETLVLVRRAETPTSSRLTSCGRTKSLAQQWIIDHKGAPVT